MTNSISFQDGTGLRVKKSSSIRVQNNIMARRERVILDWLCSHMPSAVTPDLLTMIGVVGAAIAFAGYIGSRFDPAFFLLSIVGLLVNWFGDSLDGSLARFRGIEMPRYGYFVDHSADAVSDFLIVVGLGLTAYIRLDIALFVLIGYFLLSMHVFLFNHVYGIFQISFISLGPTELRVGLALINILMYSYGPLVITILDRSLSAYDLVFGLIAVTLITVFAFNMALAAHRLRREDVQVIGPKLWRATASLEPAPGLFPSE